MLQLMTSSFDRALRTCISSLSAQGAALWLTRDSALTPVAAVGIEHQRVSHTVLPDNLQARTDSWSVGGDHIGVPVRRQGILLGALVAYGEGRRSWSAGDLALLLDHAEAIADQVELENWRVREPTQRSPVEQRYRQLFERAHDAIYMTTRAGGFIDVNPAMIEMFGYTRTELLSRNASDLYLHPSDRTRFQKEIEKSGFVREHELQMKRKDGRVLHCLKTASVDLDESGKVIGYQGILHDITERKRAESVLVHSAFHDPLTGLPNRALLMDRLERLQSYARRHKKYKFALMYMDLDRFKTVNDSFGHLVGDQLLISVARRLEGCVRQEDTVARLGGDEFAVILDAITDGSHATRVAERILHELQVPFHIEGRDIGTVNSIGIALSVTGYDVLEDMIRDADAAMYRAKTGGRNCYEVFDLAMHDEAVTLLRLEGDLVQAIKRDEFVLQYLPVFTVPDRKLAGLEALVRWNHPERGRLMPGQFIEAADDSGIIVPIGWWVMRQACAQLKRWQDQQGAGVAKLAISVNLSGRQFLQQDLVARIDQILKETGLAPQCLKLEIAEQDVMRNADPAVALLAELDRRGIQLSIDDFGTGYSSLSYLQRFPLDSIKIDRSFVALMGNGQSGKSAGLVRSILALGHSLNIPAVAEGVETERQFAELHNLGVQYAQGFLLSQPIDADAVPALLR